MDVLISPPASEMQDDLLMVALDQVRLALTFAKSKAYWDWPEALRYALSRVEKGLNLHLAGLESDEQWEAEIDHVPTLARKKQALCQLCHELRDSAFALKWEAHCCVEAGRHPSMSKLIPDWIGLSRRTQQFLAAVEDYLNEDAALMLKGINTDVGVGD